MGECHENDQEIARLNGLIHSLDQTIANQHREITALRAEDSDEMGLLREEVGDLKKEIADVHFSYESIRESNERLRKQRADLLNDVEKLNGEIKGWGIRCDALLTAISVLGGTYKRKEGG